MLPRKRILAWVVVAGAAAAAAAVLLPEPTPPGEVVQPVRPEARGEGKAEQGRLAALPERESIGRQKGELFGSRSWAPPPAPPKAPQAPVVEAPPPAPTPPPMPYRVAGQVVHDGVAQVVLAKGDRVITVREGQLLEDGYRVDSIRADGVTLVYIPLDARQHIPAATALALAQPPPAKAAREETAAAADTRPAQLRWEGPERVQAGSNFNVALKLTSHQPVRATPLQLSFDDKLLEPVAVRPGGFFAPGSFSYRVNPGGSIFVGGFGRGTTSADADFVIVTFKPIRAGTTAELKLSSVVLQGAAGRAIAHEPLASFKTSVQ